MCYSKKNAIYSSQLFSQNEFDKSFHFLTLKASLLSFTDVMQSKIFSEGVHVLNLNDNTFDHLCGRGDNR